MSITRLCYQTVKSETMAEAERVEQLETITDNLANGYKRLQQGSMRTSAELQKERLLNPRIRTEHFYTANCLMYDIQKGEVYVHFLTGDNNFFFKNIDEVCGQLITTGNYVVPASDVAEAKRAAKSFKMSDLDLTKFDNELSYFEINTTEYDNLNPAQRQFAEAVHGEGDDFKAVMGILSGVGTQTTTIYVLNPKYVRNYFKQHTDYKAIASGCTMRQFLFDSDVFAHSKGVGHSSIRGIRRRSLSS